LVRHRFGFIQLVRRRFWIHPIGSPSFLVDSSHPPARQLVGKTRWVFRRPHGSNLGNPSGWGITHVIPVRLGTPAADGRPSGSSLQAVEQVEYPVLNLNIEKSSLSIRTKIPLVDKNRKFFPKKRVRVEYVFLYQ
jgi:hypothetical protein